MDLRWHLVYGALALGLAAPVAQAADLLDTFDPPFAGATATQPGTGPAPTVTAGGPTGNFLRLINDGVNSQTNYYAYDRTSVGASTRVTASFDLRGFSADQPADGMSFVLLPTANYGVSGAGPTFTAEEPNVANALAVGFDSYNFATSTDVSLHFNGSERTFRNLPLSTINFRNNVMNNATLTTEAIAGGSRVSLQLTSDVNGAATVITPFTNFYIAGLNAYENRLQFAGRTGGLNMAHDLDNVSAKYSNTPSAATYATAHNFDGSGTPYVTTAVNATTPPPALLSGGPSGTFLRLIHDGTNSQENSIVFDATPNGLSAASNPAIQGSFDFRAQSPSGGPADGFSLVLLPTDTYGTQGPGPSFTAEEPNVAGAFSLGFDFYPDPATNAISAHFNGVQLAENNLATGVLDLDNGLFHRLNFNLTDFGDDVLLDVSVTPDVFGAAGSPVSVFNDLLIPNMQLYDFRAMFRGRTGGQDMNVDLDNISIQSTPEPSSIAAWLFMGIAGLAVVRRFRKQASA